MSKPSLASLSAGAFGLAGLLWIFTAGMILLTGRQPPLALEVGQLLLPLGCLALYLTLDRPSTLARVGLFSSLLGIAGTVLALIYPLVSGARVSAGEDFVLPYSLFVLGGAVGGFLALLCLGLSLWQSGAGQWRERTVPLLVAVSPLPLALLAAIHIEVPILLIGAAWLMLAVMLHRRGQTLSGTDRK